MLFCFVGGDVVQLTNNGHAFSKDELEKVKSYTNY